MDDERFRAAVAEFARLNGEDPNVVDDGGRSRPRELVHAERLSRWVERVAGGEPSEPLRLAAWCQHLRRWEIPRSSYPEGRTGYLAWRKALSKFHADGAAAVLERLGYDEATIERVRHINLKRSLKFDADVQAMEDALCLSFLENELAEFAERHEDDKVVAIIQKTWSKMSDRGHELARGVKISGRAARLVDAALA